MLGRFDLISVRYNNLIRTSLVLKTLEAAFLNISAEVYKSLSWDSWVSVRDVERVILLLTETFLSEQVTKWS